MQKNLNSVVIASGLRCRRLRQTKISDYLGDTRSVIQRCVAQMPSHADFIAAHCASEELQTC